LEPEPEPKPKEPQLTGTGTVMLSGSGTGFEPGSNMKCITKVKKFKIRGQLSGKPELKFFRSKNQNRNKPFLFNSTTLS
jgi:hypothetical protein